MKGNFLFHISVLQNEKLNPGLFESGLDYVFFSEFLRPSLTPVLFSVYMTLWTELSFHLFSTVIVLKEKPSHKLPLDAEQMVLRALGNTDFIKLMLNRHVRLIARLRKART